MIRGVQGLIGRYTPSLLLDFSKGVMPASLTFGRASVATRVNASGLMETMAANVPRFDYDPITLAYRGLLIESSRTNLFLDSDLTSGSAWGTFGVNNGVRTFFTTGGALSGYTKIRRISTTGFEGMSQNVSVSSGVNYQLTAYLRLPQDGSTAVDCFLQMPGNSAFVLAAAGSLTNTWKRFTAFFTASSTTSQQFGFFASNAAAGTGFDICNAQLEIGTFVSSYIPTTTATVQRAGESTSQLIGSWYNAVQGSTYSDFTPAVNGNNNGVYSFNAGNGQNRMDLRAGPGGGGIAIISVGNVGQSVPAAQGTTALVNHRFGFSYIAGGTSLVKDGGTVATAATASIPTITQLQIGNLDGGSGSNNLDGWIKKFVYYPRRLSDNSLKSLTI